ncbi:hypothetical protein EDD18DRAFT_1194502, partial [Armillaria luteobubalina]
MIPTHLRRTTSIFSVSTVAKKKMSDQETDSQRLSIPLRAAISWLLYEPSRHPEDQMRVRREVATANFKAPGALTCDDYDAMAWLNAVIK